MAESTNLNFMDANQNLTYNLDHLNINGQIRRTSEPTLTTTFTKDRISTRPLTYAKKMKLIMCLCNYN